MVDLLSQFGDFSADTLNACLKFYCNWLDRFMLHSPHWLEGSRVASQSGNHMPVYMGELVAKEFIVDLLGLVDL
jgi:hypothetical protein